MNRFYQEYITSISHVRNQARSMRQKKGTNAQYYQVRRSLSTEIIWFKPFVIRSECRNSSRFFYMCKQTYMPREIVIYISMYIYFLFLCSSVPINQENYTTLYKTQIEKPEKAEKHTKVLNIRSEEIPKINKEEVVHALQSTKRNKASKYR